MLCHACPNVINHNDLRFPEKTVVAEPGTLYPNADGVTGMAAGLGKLLKLSKRHHVLKHGLERMLHFDVILRDVHGHIHLCLDLCYVPFFF